MAGRKEISEWSINMNFAGQYCQMAAEQQVAKTKNKLLEKKLVVKTSLLPYGRVCLESNYE